MLTKAPAAPRRVFAPWADAAAQPVVAFRNVSKRFGGFTAISDVSLDIYAGEFFALLGPSGCGKTTLMRMVAGFEEPTTGEVLLDGEGLAGIPPYRRPVNMMFQSYALFPHMSVADNIAFGLKQERLGKAEIGRRVEEMLALVQLEGLAGRKPDQLSGGQRQRVALARSLAKKPRVLLLDEPLAALDKKLREETQFELVDLQQRLHLTFVIVTHDQEEAMTVADRIAVMDQGRILQVAPPAEIYEQPNCRAVASFIGDINLIEARVSAAAADGLRLTAFGGALAIATDSRVGVQPGAAAWFAVRPEKVAIALWPPADASVNCVSGEVYDIGYLGDVSIFRVRLDGGGTMRAAMSNRARRVEQPIGWGDRVYLSWARDAGLVFAE
ncbi:MAG: ABC transporter ATP-binding protein [Bauldia sp.]